MRLIPLPAASEVRRLAAFRALRHFNVLRRCIFTALPRFVGPSHCLPRGSGQNILTTRTSTLKGVGTKPADVRFGSKADMCSAIGHVRFTSKSDRERDSRKGHVRFTPKSGDPCGAKCAGVGEVVKYEPTTKCAASVARLTPFIVQPKRYLWRP